METPAPIQPAGENSRSLAARCYCGGLCFDVYLPTRLLPISAYMCHCSRCRYIYGALAVTHAKMPRGIGPQFVKHSSGESPTTVYHPQGSIFSHYFCKTCGCHMGGRSEAEDAWYLSIALFPQDETVFRIDEHCFTQSAPNGLHQWLSKIGQRPIKSTDSGDRLQRVHIPPREVGDDGRERLRAQCDCGGISFTIPRPTDEVLIDPYMSGYVSPVEKNKWKAMTDVCNDCRLITGVHLNAWTYVPLKLVEPQIGLSLKHGTMESYVSSPGATRTFCGVCGATALFWHQSRHTTDDNHVINISVGLLRSAQGVTAVDWLTWRTNELGWLDAGCDYNHDLYQSINAGHRAWGIKEKGRLVDFKLPPAR